MAQRMAHTPERQEGGTALAGEASAAVERREANIAELLSSLRDIAPDARIEPFEGPHRFCTNAACMCQSVVVLGEHTFRPGHFSLDAPRFDAAGIARKIAASPCTCCKEARRLARRAAPGVGGTPHELCPAPAIDACGDMRPVQPGRDAAAPRQCHSCGSTAHLAKACPLGRTLRREHQFLACGPDCFVRRFVVPLHRARANFAAGQPADRPLDLVPGRVDVATRLVSAALISSQRLRHNTQLLLPFLGDEDSACTMEVRLSTRLT